MTNHSHYRVLNLYVWCLQARKHVVLHLPKGHRERLAIFNVVKHQHSIAFSVRVVDLPQKNGIVTSDEVWLTRSDLIFEFTEHDLLLIFKLFFLAVDGLREGCNRPLQLEFDIGHHLAAC